MKKIYLILPLLAGIMFGSTGIFVRTLTDNGIDFITLLFLRFSIGTILIFFEIIINDKSLLKMQKEDIPVFIITGLCILGLNLCYNHSINTISLSLAAILLSTAPVFVLIIAYFIFNEKITPLKVISIIFVLIGCILATGLIEENIASTPILGIISGIGAAIFWGMYTIASRKSIDSGKHTLTILFYSIIIISIITVPFTSFEQISSFIAPSPIESWVFLILHSFISFALPYQLITVSLNHLDAGTVVILCSVEPIAALVFGIIAYNEIPSLLMLIGMFIAIIALLNLSIKSADNKNNNET